MMKFICLNIFNSHTHLEQVRYRFPIPIIGMKCIVLMIRAGRMLLKPLFEMPVFETTVLLQFVKQLLK